MSKQVSLEELQRNKDYWNTRVRLKQDELNEAFTAIIQNLGPKLTWILEQKSHDLAYAATKEALIQGAINERNTAAKLLEEANASQESEGLDQSQVPSPAE